MKVGDRVTTPDGDGEVTLVRNGRPRYLAGRSVMTPGQVVVRLASGQPRTYVGQQIRDVKAAG